MLNDRAAAAITPTNMKEATTLPCTGLLMAMRQEVHGAASC
jgi:hypothetical protein